jgi:hypothetical protein
MTSQAPNFLTTSPAETFQRKTAARPVAAGTEGRL